MLRFVPLVVLSLTLASLLACSDLGSDDCVEGQARIDGVCHDTPTGGSGGARYEDPGPKTETTTLGCTSNVTPNVFIVGWDLTVDPGPILGGQAFGAIFRGLAVVDESLLDLSQILVPGGYKRTNVVELQATVHVRSGVTSGAMDVVLTREPVQRTCTYDNSGMTGSDAGPFPPCSQENENLDGSNEDCTGLGGVPDPENPCGQFATIPTSKECDPGRVCDSRGKAGPGSQCAQYGFCIIGDLEIPLEGAYEGYLAAGSGDVLFGWDDESTGAEIDQSSGPNGGTIILPPAVFDEPTGPNGFRIVIGTAPVAFECTMGVGTARLTPTPDTSLISFPIQTP